MVAALQPHLKSLMRALPAPPVPLERIHSSVRKVLSETESKTSSESKKSQWEFLLRRSIYDFAATEGDALKNEESDYYDRLCLRLDIITAFTEQDACEQTFPFTILQDLLETQTIASCSHIFSWLEERAPALTVDMVPQKGKALILLRSLNDLLRRLSNSGSTTKFCGRILTFLSGVFPLGERSGVNLRGAYGETWTGTQRRSPELESKGEVEGADADKMAVNEEASIARKIVDQKQEFYDTFWSLQLPFSKPSILVEPREWENFKHSVDLVLPKVKDATTKDRASLGKSAHAGAKRKRDAEVAVATDSKSDYFSAKYLTSPDLLDLEIADPQFRRQFLFQLLILLHHLLNFTESAKASWCNARNRSLQMDFTLGEADAQWTRDVIRRTIDEARQTLPNGRLFSETLATVLEREVNWVRWKNEMCPPFDLAPWIDEIDEEGSPSKKRKINLEESTRKIRRQMRDPPAKWPHELGSQPLSEIWEMGYRELRDLENYFSPGNIKGDLKQVKAEDARIQMRKKQLEDRERRRRKQAEDVAAAAVSKAQEHTQTHQEPANVTEGFSASKESSGAGAGAEPSDQQVNNPIHPSLPAKPGTRTQVASSAPPPIAVTTADNKSTPAPAVQPAAMAPIVLPPDDMSARYEENKQRWTWLALRTARDKYLHHFVSIGTGDLEALVKAVDDEERAANGDIDEKKVDNSVAPTRRYKVISIDNYSNSLPEALNRVSALSKSELPPNPSAQELASTEIDVYKCDLRNADDVRAVFAKYGKGGIWGVIHIAAMKAVGESSEIPLTYYENNVAGMIKLLQIMDEFDCTRLVYSSSATVYGTPPTIPIPETTRLEALSPYGRTKVMCEQIIGDLCEADPTRWQALSLRYFNPAGAHPSGAIGEDPLGTPLNLLPILAHIAVGRIKDSTLRVFGNDYPTPDGTCVRDYLHIIDLAVGHLLALDALEPQSKIFPPDTVVRYKVYNLGKGHGQSVMSMVDAMRKATGFNYKTEVIGRRRGDVPNLTADPSLAEKELGFHAPQDLETMCRDLWNWQSTHPQGYGPQ
ncbi:UDP-glucose 4-epimerase [Fistulina hepatica ATCC 64428]|uniref:UDP-glucose 4-epimerase n=1 Tax=Fistulina hepatica ATCC 64428 TaxID=1128425 RepID=A0A0D7AGR3_9AGAR|nr:UDP-glucose 4-epimerase [Fistulina hepatica ATCC 64428]